MKATAKIKAVPFVQTRAKKAVKPTQTEISRHHARTSSINWLRSALGRQDRPQLLTLIRAEEKDRVLVTPYVYGSTGTPHNAYAFISEALQLPEDEKRGGVWVPKKVGCSVHRFLSSMLSFAVFKRYGSIASAPLY